MVVVNLADWPRFFISAVMAPERQPRFFVRAVVGLAIGRDVSTGANIAVGLSGLSLW